MEYNMFVTLMKQSKTNSLTGFIIEFINGCIQDGEMECTERPQFGTEIIKQRSCKDHII